MNCQSCDNHTTNTCTRCGESNYCDGNCQSQHWSVHKDVCKDAQLGRALQRIAHILHEAYLTFRENTWDTPIKRIVNGTQTLTVYDGDQRQNPAYFTAFPNHLVQNDVQKKMALLTAWTCNEPYGFFHSMIVKLLQGLNIDVEECLLVLRNLPRNITVILPSGQPMSNSAYNHAVLRVRSRRPGSKAWVIDLCGAQYGIYQPFHDSTQYFSQYVQTQSGRSTLGQTSLSFATMAQIRGNHALVYGLVGRAAEVLDAAMSTWELQHAPLSQLRTLSGATFDGEKASLLVTLDSAVRSFIAANDFTALVQRERRYEQGGLLGSMG